MSQDPYPRRPSSADRLERQPPGGGGHPAHERAPHRATRSEEVLRLIARAPEPFYPAEFLQRTGADPANLDAVLSHLALEGLIEKVRGRSEESGSGVVLTALGQEVVRDTTLLDRLVRGDPLRDNDVGGVIRQGMRTAAKPYLTYALIALNAGLFLLGWAKPEWQAPVYGTDAKGRTVLMQDAGDAYKAWRGDSALIAKGEWWRLLTCTFLHGNLMHVGCNMFSLFSLGAFVERAWGRWRMLLIYLIAGWVGSCLGIQYASYLVGASGSVCGLLAAVGTWFLLYRKHIPREFASQGLWQVAISVVMIAVIGFVVPNVSNAGHLGGGIGGAMAALALHVQRFGMPGMSRKVPAARWAIAVVLLLMLPALSYLQLQRAWASKDVAGNDKEKESQGVPNVVPDDNPDGGKRKDDPDVKPDGGKKKDGGKQKEDPFPRQVLFPVRDTADAVEGVYNNVPLDVVVAKADPKGNEALLGRIQEERTRLVEDKRNLSAAQTANKDHAAARTKGLALLEAASALCDALTAYLKQPTVEGKDGAEEQFAKFQALQKEYGEMLRKFR